MTVNYLGYRITPQDLPSINLDANGRALTLQLDPAATQSYTLSFPPALSSGYMRMDGTSGNVTSVALSDDLLTLTSAEIAQLANLNATTVSATQWSYLGALDQTLATTSSPTFVAPMCTSSMKLQDTGVGTNTYTLQAPTLAGNLSLTLPTTAGASSNVLQTDGAGVLSWRTQPAIIYGELYFACKFADYTTWNFSDADWVTLSASATLGAWVQITGFTSGESRGLTLGVSGMTVATTGVYRIKGEWAGNIAGATANLIELGIGVDGTPPTTTASANVVAVVESSATNNRPTILCGSRVLSLTAGNVVGLYVRWTAGAGTGQAVTMAASKLFMELLY